MKTRLLFLFACLPALALPAVTAAPAPSEAPRYDWPQWRGPDRTDVSKETGLLQDWPAGGPKLLWTCDEAGTGFSGPSVVGDRLFSMGADEQTEYVFCLDVKNGKKLWSAPAGPRLENGWGDGPRCTPTVDGNRVYALAGKGNLVCLGLSKGDKAWEKNLPKDLGGGVPGWGYCESPLVDGDKVVVTPGGAKGTVAALDKKSGDVLWRSKGFTDGAHYSSLVIGNAGGIKQYVQMTGMSVAGVAADDGRLLWRWQYSSQNLTAAIPTPVVQDDLVYSTAGYGAGCRLLKVVRDGESKEKAEEVYANKDMTNLHGGVVKVGEYLYGYSEGGGWTCQDFKTGKAVWKGNKLGRGSLTCADGRLYLYSEGDGTCVLIEPSPDGWKEHGRFKIPRQTGLKRKSGHIWTHPVVANGRLYLRDQDLIFAFDVKAGAGAQ
jgi:outer membrane protein assembly factor BamB